jgi:putative exosortase-associated protein (TIGR04073 family)
MRKLLLMSVGLMWLMVAALPVSAQDDETVQEESSFVIETERIPYEDSALNKLGRGLINVFTCWLEIPAGMYKVSAQKGEFLGSTLGALQGTVTSVLRAGTAVCDVATFAVPPYDKPTMLPEYAVQEVSAAKKTYLDSKI